jgi:ABC-type arginine transport system ATPase subunit
VAPYLGLHIFQDSSTASSVGCFPLPSSETLMVALTQPDEPGKSSFLYILNLLTSAKSLILHKITQSQFGDIRIEAIFERTLFCLSR